MHPCELLGSMFFDNLILGKIYLNLLQQTPKEGNITILFEILRFTVHLTNSADVVWLNTAFHKLKTNNW